jgi:acetyl-CoA acetyltransferase
MAFEPQENDIAIVGVAQTAAHARFDGPEVVLIMECVNRLLGDAGIERDDVGFTIAGSCDYLSGMPFAFVSNVDGMGAWPPVYESHVEMDGAWALFEAWLRLQMGDIDVAMVVGSGKSSPCKAREVFHLQADPYVVAPLGLDPDALAGIQARALIDAGKATEADIADVVARSRAAAEANPHAQVAGSVSTDELLAAPSALVNPSGGPLVGDPVMATGLTRIIEVAKRIAAGDASRGIAHAASGAALQQNLVCVLQEGA